jgi:ketosteroid isomerase-like protein
MNDAMAEAIEAVAACERRRCRALVERDLAALNGLVRDDLVHIHATGSADDRAGYLKGVETAIDFLKVERQDLNIRIYADVAIMTGGLQQTIRIVRTGVEHVMNAMATQVWVREDGAWKQASFHACLIK